MKPSTALNRLSVGLMAVCLVACGSIQNSASHLKELIEPYKVEVVQGNVVTEEQVKLLKTGMTRVQVREILGTPLITSLFHAQRWDYAFTIKRQGAQPLQRHVSVFFENDAFARYESDELPTEAEFTARIDSKLKGKVSVPKLQASDEELKPYLRPRTEPSDSTERAPVSATYPPLESK